MGALKLVVGLGNPGLGYADTRHNVGAAWVREMARRYSIPLSLDTKFNGEIGRGLVAGVDIRFLLPRTYMNNSGEAVGSVSRFYKIDPSEILIAYDEVAFESGTAKFKHGGGSNGHNGVKSVVAGLGNKDGFFRLRIGVGHPGSKDQLIPYLTEQIPQQSEREQIAQSVSFAESIVVDVVQGQWQRAMTALHAPEPNAVKTEPNPGET